eukprot:2710292-Rhodomonas_salina.1
MERSGVKCSTRRHAHQGRGPFRGKGLSPGLTTGSQTRWKASWTRPAVSAGNNPRKDSGCGERST